MVRRALTIISLVLSSGCATTEYVHISPAEPPIINRPHLETSTLQPGDSAARVLQAHRLTIKALQQWGQELEAALDAYRSTK